MPVAVHTRQISHIATAATSEVAGLFPSNAVHEWGTYHTAHIEQDRIRIRSSHFAGPPFWLGVLLPAGTVSEPKLDYDTERRLWLFYTDADLGGIARRVSDDEGETWSDAEMAIAGGTHPEIARGLDGTLIAAAFVGGAIVAQVRGPGDQGWSTPFAFQDEFGGDLQWEDDSFGIVQAWDGNAPWWLHAVAVGDTETSNWMSHDIESASGSDPATWTRDTS